MKLIIYVLGFFLVVMIIYFYFFHKAISADPEIINLREKFISHTKLCNDIHDINSKKCHILQDIVKERDNVLRRKGAILVGRWLHSIWGEIIIEELYLPKNLTFVFIIFVMIFVYLLQKQDEQ